MKNVPKAFNFKIWIFYCLLSISLVLLSACGSGGGGDGDDTSETSSSGSGSVSFKLVLQNSSANRALNKQQLNNNNSQFECKTDEYLIATIEARVSDENDELLAEGGPFDCEDRKGNISDVEAGDGRIVEVLAKDQSGETIFDGKSERFSIEPGQTKDVGKIVIEPVNSAPVLNPIGDQLVNENQLLEFVISATDPDINDTLTFSCDSTDLDCDEFFDPSTQIFSWRPNFDMAGVYDVTFIVADDGVPSLSDSENISITVADINRPPELAPIGRKEIDEGQLLEFTVTATDPDVGDILSFSIGNRPTGASFVDNGNGTATFSWIPAFNASGNYQVIFTVTDDSTQPPGMLSDFEEVTITVGDFCRPPVLTPIGPKKVDEDQLLEFTITATDPDVESLLSFSIGNKPNGANFVDNKDKTATFNWTPGFEDADNYPVIFTVTDDCQDPGPQSDFEEVTITVGDVCRPPVLAPIGSKEVDEGQLLAFTITATDPDIGDTLTFSCDSTDLDCDAVFDPDTQRFSWRPGFNRADRYTVRFTVSDDCPPPDGPQRDFEEVTITVGDVCRSPVLAPIGDQNTKEGQLLEFTITGTDPDIGDTLTFSCDSEHFEGTFCDSFDPNTQRFSWTPSFFAAGMYDVSFTVTDSCPPPDGPLSDFEDLTITVDDVCRAPVLDRIGPQSVNVNEELRFTVTATDPDLPDDALSFSCVSEDIDCEEYFNPFTQTFSWTPGYLDFGTKKVRFIVTDACDDPDGPRRDFEDVTIIVDPECEGATCKTFVPCEPSGGCIDPVCTKIVEGGGICVEGKTECGSLKECESSNDCTGGGLCVQEGCCEGKPKVCFPPEAWCANIPEPESQVIQATDIGPTFGGE